MYFYEKMENLFNETWKPIKYYEGLYEVSSLGNVRSLDRYIMCGKQYCFLKGKPMKTCHDSNGYLITTLSKNSKVKRHYLHRLVAEAFIPNPNSLPCIDHINTVKDDNKVENLKWCSYKENMNNPLTIEHTRSKEANEKRLAARRKNQSCCCEIPVYYIDEDGSKISFKSMNEAQRQTNVHHSSISRSIAKKRPISGKQWYKEEKATAN